MKVLLSLLCTFCLFACQAPLAKVKHNTLTEAEKEAGWQLLFNGKNMEGWHTYGLQIVHGWEIADDAMHAMGAEDGGDIVSDATYSDFELSLEWKVSTKANSGIFFRVVEDTAAFKTVYATGPEYQLLDDASYEGEVEEMQKTGSNYAMHAVSNRPAKAAGEWNHSRMLVQGLHVEHWLNGEKIVEYELQSSDWTERMQNSKWKDYPAYGLAREGKIALQDHGAQTSFRNVKIRPLSPVISLFNGQDLEGWKVHGTEKWYVDNGVLVCESGPDKAYGYLATVDSFKNLDLELEFLQEADGNSGVFFRSSLDGTKISGWQVEVAPPDHDTGGIYESYGRGWLKQIDPEHEGYLKMGEWNQLRVRVVDDHVQTWLNGHKMVDFHDEKIGEAEGSIALQIHDGGGIKVRWRNLNVREI
ncbi:MAG: DUF1080 domain-containing protein [Bacteroidota bacterium]